MALSAERTDTRRREGNIRTYDVAADAVIYKGALVVLDAGYLKPGFVDDAVTAVGVAKESVDNTDGSNGDLTCRVEKGVWLFDNSADADEITAADIGAVCYIVDDRTVAKTSDTDARSAAGVVDQVDDDGVWVRID